MAEAHYFATGTLRSTSALGDLLAAVERARPAWHAEAACAGSDVDFYDDSVVGMAKAKAVCAGCPAVHDCRQAAADNDERWGVWGGATPRERGTGRYGRTVEADASTDVDAGERPHGVRSTYNAGCRCDWCREAAAAAMRARRAAQRAS